MNIKRAGEVIDRGRVKYRALGHKRPLTPAPDLDLFSVEIELSRGELLAALERPYSQLRQEARADYRASGEYDPECFSETGFVDLAALLDEWPQHLEGLITDYMCFDLLGALFDNDGAAPAAAVINAIKQITLDGDTARLSAAAFRPVE